MTIVNYYRCFRGIAIREGLRFIHQRGRFFSALVRPLVWLFIFAAGFRSILGVSIIPPYETYVLYEVYIAPGLIGMILLFNGMQSSLSMVYDREMGSMRVLLVSPLPRWFLLLGKLSAGVSVAVIQVYVFLVIFLFLGCRTTVVRLPCIVAGAVRVRTDARRHGIASVFARTSIGKLCGSDEFRDLSDVLRFFSFVPSVAGTGFQRDSLLYLRIQSFHTCSRNYSFCPVWTIQFVFNCICSCNADRFRELRDIWIRSLTRIHVTKAGWRRWIVKMVRRLNIFFGLLAFLPAAVSAQF